MKGVHPVPDLLYEKHGNYAIFTMNRPDRLNAIGGQMADDLADALADFTNDPGMRVGILTGTGRAFSAGADLKAMSERNAEIAKVEADYKAGTITLEQRRDILRRYQGGGGGLPFSRNPKPFIAAVNGLAVGGGTERAIDCDIRICSTEAYFGLWEVKRGILPGSGIINMPRIINFGEAMYILMTADRISPEEALRIHLVHEVTSPEGLMPRAVQIAEMIASNAPIAVAGSKAVAMYWRHLAIDEQQKYQNWTNRWVGASEDSKEGPKAFAEKRTPNWQNR
jgi:enoyl-CoA hydratase/carnithine racemase